MRARHDGWSPALQLRLIVHLARGAGVDEAARRLGRSRQSAYALRGRAGGESFAAAWDAAIGFPRQAAGAAWMPGASRSGVATLLVPRHYRGRLIGYVLREDMRGAMARLGRLDRLAERLDAEAGGEGLRVLAERLGPLLGES